MSLRCTLCKGEEPVYLERGSIVAHLEDVHADKLTNVARWPDGELVVMNEDELDGQ